MTKYRILMADGNLQFQTAVRDCLAAQEQVAQFETVTDGQAAIDALRAGHYDALITELIAGAAGQRPCGKPAGRDGCKRHAA